MESLKFDVIVVGKQYSGKSTLIKALCKQQASEGDQVVVYDPHLQIEVTFRLNEIQNIETNEIQNIICALLVFDITKKSEIMEIEKQVGQIKKKYSEGFILLVGCKSDLRFVQDKKEIPIAIEDAEKLATSLGLLYIEVSGKTKKNTELLLKIMRIRTSHILRKNARFKQSVGKFAPQITNFTQQQSSKNSHESQYSNQGKYQSATTNLLSLLQKSEENSPNKEQYQQSQKIDQDDPLFQDQNLEQEEKDYEFMQNQINSKFAEDIQKENLQNRIVKDQQNQKLSNIQNENYLKKQNFPQKDNNFQKERTNQNENKQYNEKQMQKDILKQKYQTFEQIQQLSQNKRKEPNQNASVTIDSPDLSMSYEDIQNEFITPQFQEKTRQIGDQNSIESNEKAQTQVIERSNKKEEEKQQPVVFYSELDQKNAKVLLKLQINLGRHGIVMLDVFRNSNAQQLAAQALKYVPQSLRNELYKELSTLIQMKIASFCHKVSKNKNLVLSKEENTNIALGQVEVDLEGGKKAILEVHKGDNIPQLVSKFCQYYRLKPGSEQELINAAYTLL